MPVSIEERYNRATRSSKLRANEHPGDIDVVIAAGWVAESFGTALYRVRAEFDSVAADLRRDMVDGVTGRLLIMLRLKTLERAKVELGRFALVLATKGQHWLNDATVFAVAGRVLDVFLDPNCHHCTGRGFVGGEHRGEHRVICRPCHGSGVRRDRIGKNDAEQAFAARLLAEIDRSLASVAHRMRGYLRNDS